MLRVGIDLVEVATVERSLAGEHRERYLERVYTAGELADCTDADGGVRAEGLAARFAAKEAAIKALPGAGEGVGPTEIEVVRATDGSVSLRLSGRAAELLKDCGGTEIAVSLTHEGAYATATVIIA